LVQHHSTEPWDSRVLYPATSEDLYGVPSNWFEVGAGPSGASVSWIGSDGASGSSNLGANGQYATWGFGAYGDAPAFKVSTNNPIGADQLADCDGGETTTFLPLKELGTVFGSANPAGYIAIAAPYPSTTCKVYDSTGSEVASQTGGTGEINKLCFGCGSSSTWISGGWKMICDKPVFAYYENDAYDSDETNLLSYNQIRQFAYPEPTVTIGEETAAGISKAGAYGLGVNTTAAFATVGGQTILAPISSGWNHIVLTYNKNAASNQQKLYVNGELKAQGTLTEAISTNDNSLLIGDLIASSSFIDDLRIYSRALPQT
jgi:hypothetical protein